MSCLATDIRLLVAAIANKTLTIDGDKDDCKND